ncbi:hypothetical protein [Akkermansia sp.]|uniref:hypothetical protein n=1 Tax=Akkermansia sp. TaxID=1872421 RepID=UPI00399353BA
MSNNQIIRVVAYHFQADCEIQGDRLTRTDSCPDQAQILSRSETSMTLWWPKYRSLEYLHHNPLQTNGSCSTPGRTSFPVQ